MESTTVSNPEPSNSIHRRKRKKKTSQDRNKNILKWKSDRQQQLYSSKLLRALSQLRISQQTSASSPGQAVREAADKALAVAAKGKTRWSREILKSRIKLKFRKQKRQRGSAALGLKRQKVRMLLGYKGKNSPAVQRKVKVLSRLVPGCRKEPMPVVLEEAGDYIAALEMQVRAMSALAELLSGGSSSGAAAAPPS